MLNYSTSLFKLISGILSAVLVLSISILVLKTTWLSLPGIGVRTELQVFVFLWSTVVLLFAVLLHWRILAWTPEIKTHELLLPIILLILNFAFCLSLAHAHPNLITFKNWFLALFICYFLVCGIIDFWLMKIYYTLFKNQKLTTMNSFDFILMILGLLILAYTLICLRV